MNSLIWFVTSGKFFNVISFEKRDFLFLLLNILAAIC